ncbi:MAG: hypothetical protein PVJ53_00220 [Desulfobacterales bacterium]
MPKRIVASENRFSDLGRWTLPIYNGLILRVIIHYPFLRVRLKADDHALNA